MGDGEPIPRPCCISLILTGVTAPPAELAVNARVPLVPIGPRPDVAVPGIIGERPLPAGVDAPLGNADGNPKGESGSYAADKPGLAAGVPPLDLPPRDRGVWDAPYFVGDSERSTGKVSLTTTAGEVGGTNNGLFPGKGGTLGMLSLFCVLEPEKRAFAFGADATRRRKRAAAEPLFFSGDFFTGLADGVSTGWELGVV